MIFPFQINPKPGLKSGLKSAQVWLTEGQSVYINSSMRRSLSGHRAGGGLWRLLQDRFSSQVIGQSAISSPDCELTVDPHLDHLLLPGDGDVPRGKLIEKLLVLVLQLHAFDGGEGPDVVDVLGINRLGVWHERGRKDPWGETTQDANIKHCILIFI